MSFFPLYFQDISKFHNFNDKLISQTTIYEFFDITASGLHPFITELGMQHCIFEDIQVDTSSLVSFVINRYINFTSVPNISKFKLYGYLDYTSYDKIKFKIPIEMMFSHNTTLNHFNQHRYNLIYSKIYYDSLIRYSTYINQTNPILDTHILVDTFNLSSLYKYIDKISAPILTFILTALIQDINEVVEAYFYQYEDKINASTSVCSFLERPLTPMDIQYMYETLSSIKYPLDAFNIFNGIYTGIFILDKSKKQEFAYDIIFNGGILSTLQNIQTELNKDWKKICFQNDMLYIGQYNQPYLIDFYNKINTIVNTSKIIKTQMTDELYQLLVVLLKMIPSDLYVKYRFDINSLIIYDDYFVSTNFALSIQDEIQEFLKELGGYLFQFLLKNQIIDISILLNIDIEMYKTNAEVVVLKIQDTCLVFNLLDILYQGYTCYFV